MIDMVLCLILGFLIGRVTASPRIIHVHEEVMDVDDPRVPEDVRKQLRDDD